MKTKVQPGGATVPFPAAKLEAQQVQPMVSATSKNFQYATHLFSFTS